MLREREKIRERGSKQEYIPLPAVWRDNSGWIVEKKRCTREKDYRFLESQGGRDESTAVTNMFKCLPLEAWVVLRERMSA